jgi:hypothetical protein
VIALVAAVVLAGTGVRIAEIDVVGPVSGLVLDSGAAGESRSARAFEAGERLRITVPVPVEDAEAPVAPLVRWTREESFEEGSVARGSARFVGWRADRAAEAIAALPPGLRARTRPPLGAPDVHASAAELALLPACFVLGLALRRRRAAAPAIGIAGAAIVLALGWPRDATPASAASVLECDAQSDSALEVAASFARIDLPLADLETCVVEIPEARARVVWSQTDGDLWTASAPDASIVVLRRVDLGGKTWTRERNGALALAEAWLREEGTWTARGPWDASAPLPGPRDGAPPPGWLQAGLPQGIPILLGRIEEARGDARALRFVRLTGF